MIYWIVLTSYALLFLKFLYLLKLFESFCLQILPAKMTAAWPKKEEEDAEGPNGGGVALNRISIIF